MIHSCQARRNELPASGVVSGVAYDGGAVGYHKALAAAKTTYDDGKDDAVVFVGGSNFVVAEMLAARRKGTVN